MNNKGELSSGIIVVVVIAFVIGLVAVLSYAGMLLFPPVADAMNTLGSTMNEVSMQTGDQAMQNASDYSFETLGPIADNFEWIAYSIFIFLIITMLMLCFYVRTYPFLVFVWIFLILILVFISLFIASTYPGIREGALGSTYQSWENTDFYLRYMPHIIFVIGIIGGIIMFGIASKQPDEGGVYV